MDVGIEVGVDVDLDEVGRRMRRRSGEFALLALGLHSAEGYVHGCTRQPVVVEGSVKIPITPIIVQLDPRKSCIGFIFRLFSSLTARFRVPVTKLGRLVKDGKIKSMEEIYLFSLPVKEYQVIDMFLPTLKDEVMSIAPVQKQTSAGQRTRFKAFVAVGDFDG